MSSPPGHKIFSTAEMSFLSSQAAQRAEARTVALEARLAQTEARLAEQDRLISELASGFRQANDTISALSVVVKELQEAGFKGVDQVLTGLEGRLASLEETRAEAYKGLSQEVLQGIVRIDEGLAKHEEILVQRAAEMAKHELRLRDLEAKPKRGRPKGSKNKPKPLPQGVNVMDENAEIIPQSGDSSNPKASD